MWRGHAHGLFSERQGWEAQTGKEQKTSLKRESFECQNRAEAVFDCWKSRDEVVIKKN